MKYWSFIVISLLLFTNCNNKKYFKIEGYAQGTTFQIKYEGNNDFSADIDSILKNFDLSLSAYIDSSLISRINNNDSTAEPDKYFLTVFEKALEVYHNTDGMFDITIGPLVKAWGFLKDTALRHDSAYIVSLLGNIGMDKVRLHNNKIIKENPSVIIDVNAIAQGYSVDVVSEYLDSKGCTNYLVEIGGEIRAKGINERGKTWKIGIDKPVFGNQNKGETLQSVLVVSNKSVATSGNYRKFKTDAQGNKYSHTINPKTGFPVKSNLLSASIVAPDCITADAYATACMVMGLEKSINLITNHKELDGYFIFTDSTGNYNYYISEGLKNIFEEVKD
jgi:FAD:protein FMN transferase